MRGLCFLWAPMVQIDKVNYILIVDLINFNEIDDNCDDKTIEKHDNILIGIDEVDSISSTLDLNFAHLDI